MRNTLNKIDSKIYVRRLFCLCWIVYCVSYVGRLNYSAAMTVMINEGTLNSEQAGFIGMFYFFTYGIGQFINGFLGDKVSPKKMILAGLGVSAAANAGMGLSSHFMSMACMWGINGYFQSMIWAPIIRIFAEMLHEYDKLRCSVNIQSSSVAGTLIAYLLSAILLATRQWQSVFFMAAALLLAVAAIFGFGFQKVLIYANRHARPAKTVSTKEEIPSAPPKRGSFWKLLIHSEILFILVPTIIHGILKDGVTAWVPTYISESFDLAPSFSVLLTTVLPIINLSGAYIGWQVYRRTKKNLAKTNMFFFATAAISLFVLLRHGRASVFLTIILLAVITSSMMAINTLTISVYPLKFEKQQRVSSASGFLNAMAYIGSAFSTFAIGILVEYRGWHDTIMTWLAVAILASAICFLTIKKIQEDEKQ